MPKTINAKFRSKINGLLDEMIGRVNEAAPAARHLACASGIDTALFKRHTTETILRIRLARIADGKAIVLLAKTDPVAAKQWAHYADEEMLHDRLFLKDLKALGVEESAVYSTEPFFATKLLQGYLYYTLEHEGPRGLLCKAYFVEYMTRRTQGAWNDNIKKSLGDSAVRGAEAHLNYDANEDHATAVWNVLMSTVSSSTDEARVLEHMHAYFDLFAAYFSELARKTKVGATEQAALEVAGKGAGDR